MNIDLNQPVDLTTMSGAAYHLAMPDADGFREITRNGEYHSTGKVLGSGDACFLGVSVSDPGEIIMGKSIIIETKEHGPDRPWASTPVATANN